MFSIHEKIVSSYTSPFEYIQKMHADNTMCIVYKYHVRNRPSFFFMYFTRVTFVCYGNLIAKIIQAYIYLYYVLVARFELESTDQLIVSMQLILR